MKEPQIDIRKIWVECYGEIVSPKVEKLLATMENFMNIAYEQGYKEGKRAGAKVISYSCVIEIEQDEHSLNMYPARMRAPKKPGGKYFRTYFGPEK